MKRLPCEKERGQTLIAALLILILISGIGVSLIREMMTEIMVNRNLKVQRKLLYLAEAGQAYALAHLSRDIAWLPAEPDHEMAPGEGFSLILEFTPQGVLVTSTGRIGKKELPIQAEYFFKVDEEAFQYSLLSAGRIKLAWQDDLFLKALFANDDVILLDQEGIANLHADEGVYAAGEIFLSENICFDFGDLWSGENRVKIPQIDWSGLKAWARGTGTFLVGDRTNKVFDPAVFGPYFIDGDLVLEEMDEVFFSPGIVVVTGDLYCRDSCLEVEGNLPIFLVVGGNVEIENSTNSEGFKGLLAAEGQIRIKNMLFFDGFVISDDNRKGIYVEKANYIISNLWEDVGYCREDVFLPDKVELTWWKEGPLK